MDVPLYVYVDVPSDYSCSWMAYYTHHSNMDVPLYVYVDVPSDHPCTWMSYYILHKDMYIPQYVPPVKRKKGATLLFKKVVKT